MDTIPQKLTRVLFVLIGLSGFFIYISLNKEKIDSTLDHAQQIITGKPLDILTIQIQTGQKVKIPLPSSDIFQRDSSRQVNFFRLNSDKWTELYQSQSFDYSLNGKKIELQSESNHDFIKIEPPGRILYILKENDLSTLTYLIDKHHHEPTRSLTCLGSSCKNIRINISGTEPVQGPFLDSHFDSMKRGLPMGRWIQGAELTLHIQSAREGLFLMRLSFLAPADSIRPKLTGFISKSRFSPRSIVLTDHGLGSLWHHDIDLLVQIVPGTNQILIAFDKVMAYKDGKIAKRTAGYLTAVHFRDATEAKP